MNQPICNNRLKLIKSKHSRRDSGLLEQTDAREVQHASVFWSNDYRLGSVFWPICCYTLFYLIDMRGVIEMNEIPSRQKNRFRVFSLRSMIIAVSFVACLLSLFAFQLQRYQRNNSAITNIRGSGASVFVMDSHGYCTDGTAVSAPSLLSVLTARPALASVVDISDPSLTMSDVRKLIPDLQKLIPSCSYEIGERYIAIELSGNPNIPADLVEELRTQLPNFRFVEYTPVPPQTKTSVEIGMSQQKVIETVGELIYEQRKDWPAEKAPTVQMLGSQMNVKYTNANGFETWTYFTDDIGVGVLGIDFDANGKVIDIWSDRGIPIKRKLTKIETMIGGL